MASATSSAFNAESKLFLLPQDMLSHVCALSSRNDLLAFRGSSSACRDAVRRAVDGHDIASCSSFFPRMTRQQGRVLGIPIPKATVIKTIEAFASVFGGGCRKLNAHCVSAELCTAFRSIIAASKGRLDNLCLSGKFVTVDLLLEFCRGCPRLTKPKASYAPLIKANVMEAAVKVSLICPLLDHVALPELYRSPAETWAMNFPNLKCLEFGSMRSEESPNQEDCERIKESVARCTQATGANFYMCRVTRPLIECLLRTPLPSRLTTLLFDMEWSIDPALVLLAVQACDALRELVLPEQFAGGRLFYESLARARPELERLALGLGARLASPWHARALTFCPCRQYRRRCLREARVRTLPSEATLADGDAVAHAIRRRSHSGEPVLADARGGQPLLSGFPAIRSLLAHGHRLCLASASQMGRRGSGHPGRERRRC